MIQPFAAAAPGHASLAQLIHQPLGTFALLVALAMLVPLSSGAQDFLT